MAKTVYSLVLDDNLIAELDRVAYKKGVSRSNMVNEIIAEYLELETPQRRSSDIFSHMQALVERSQSLRFLPQQSSGFATVCGAITFRYNPTVKFAVELYKNHKKHLGELKVSLRSTNAQVLREVNKFYWLFFSLEQKYVGDVECEIEGEKYFRKLRLKNAESFDNRAVGEAIADYVNVFNRVLNLYFANLDQADNVFPQLEALYVNTLKSQKIVLS